MNNIIQFPTPKAIRPVKSEDNYYTIVAVHRGNGYNYLDHFVTQEGAYYALTHLRTRYPGVAFFLHLSADGPRASLLKWHEFLTAYNKE